jgi:predicted permease
MTSLLADLRFSARTLVKRPGFSALAILTLAIGIGVNTIAFNVLNGLLLRPFRIADNHRLGWIQLTSPGNPRGYATPAAFEALREARSFDVVDAEARVPVTYVASAGAEQAWSLVVSSSYLTTFRAPITLGRAFDRSDLSGTGIPVVLSHRFWTEKLGAPASLTGLTINAGGRVLSVVGVVGDAFAGPGGLFAPDMWIPMERLHMLQVAPRQRDERWLTLFGRLREVATVPQAEAELTALVREQAAVEGTDHGYRGQFFVMKDGHPDLRQMKPFTWMAFGAVNVVLLIACFNLSSLLIARSAERRNEIAVRTALGASRRRIVQQMLAESLLLASAAAAVALLVASWSGSLLATFSLPAPIPQRIHLDVSWTVMAFTALASVIAGVVPALLPALRATRAGQVRSVRTESGFGTRSRLRSVFVVTQIAGATVFVVLATLFARSFMTAADAELGFDVERLAVLELSPAEHGYSPEAATRLVDALGERVSSLPGVRHAALADRTPFYVGTTRTVDFAAGLADCRTADCLRAGVYDVGSHYFAAMGIPLREGREFMPSDTAGEPVVIVSESLAARTWPGQSALGRTLQIGDAGEIVRVIGVAANTRHRSLTEDEGPYLYRPLTKETRAGRMTLVVRADGDPRAIVGPLREAVRAADPNLPPAALMTMTERMKMPLWMPRTTAGFFLICGALALALASIGLFGVMYFTVAQRTREFGIRLAVGASRTRVLRGVLAEGIRLAVPGVMLGLLVGAVGGRLLAGALHGMSPADPVSLGVTAVLQLAVALAACAVPAWRATIADPIQALRQE